MRKEFYQYLTIVFAIFILSFFTLTIKAQGIYQFWGATTYGGPDDMGVLFTTKIDGTGQEVKKYFTLPNQGIAYNANEAVMWNNKLYSALTYGGLQNDGVIVAYDPATNSYSKKADFFTIGATGVKSALTVCNGKLYGVTSGGGQFDGGTLFEFDPVNNAFAKKYDFIKGNAMGFSPHSPLTLYKNKLYGMTEFGGQDQVGVVFEFDPAESKYKKCDFISNTTGNASFARLTVYNNKLWGISYYLFNGPVGGTIFCYDPQNNSIAPKAVLGNVNLISHGFIDLTLANNKLYGVAGGGANGLGAIFEFNPDNNTVTNKFNFTNATGKNECNLTLFNNKLYGQTDHGGNNGKGVIFSYDFLNNVYSTKVMMNESFGYSSFGSRLTVCNNKLYGWNKYGASYNHGGIFEYNPAINAYAKKIELGSEEVYYPVGKLACYKNKIYGTLSNKSNFDPKRKSAIYAYDMATGQYIVNVVIPEKDGCFNEQGGFLIYNNKFYGVTAGGGKDNEGILFEFNPANNNYTKKYEFKKTTGSRPYGRLALYEGKLYGTCQLGNANNAGNIFAYDLGNNQYAQKVILNDNLGKQPRSGLTFYNNKFYGTTTSGGANNFGTIFEYNPAINGIIKKGDFDKINGQEPRGEPVVVNDKMYGLTYYGGINNAGVLYEFDPFNSSISKKIDLNKSLGMQPILNVLNAYNNKLYGTTSYGGNLPAGGVLFEFDPAATIYSKKTDFSAVNGRLPESAELTTVPAPTAHGNLGFCANANAAYIDAQNNNEWVAFTDPTGDAVAEINANGNNLGNVAVNYYVHNGPTRMDGEGRFYLDRNITIQVQNQPVSPVSVRLYIRKTEFESLKNTPGSGVLVPEDIAVFKNEDNCSKQLIAPAVKINSTESPWGFDYVYSAEVNSFSSFYFGSKAYQVLPIKLLSFTGKVEDKAHKLEWKASCTNTIDFMVERSADGIHFSNIGMIKATQQDCDNPFVFMDENPISGKNYYRLKMVENGEPGKYSNILTLSRSSKSFLTIKFIPNLIAGNTATVKIESSQVQAVQLVITDMAGRQVLAKQLEVVQGSTETNIDVSRLGSGTYQAAYFNEGKRTVTRFIKK